MRIFIGPSEIAGIASSLAHGFLANGVDVDVVLSRPHSFAYEANGVGRSGLNSFWQSLGVLRNKYRKGLLGSFLGLVHGGVKWLVLLRGLFVYDAFIFLFSKTITNTQFELVLLRLLRKRLIFIYVGSDVRPPYMGAIGQTFESTPSSKARLLRRTLRVRKKVALHERYADYIVNSPSSAQFQAQRFISWFAMGVPRHFSVGMAVDTALASGPQGVRILHAPSKPLTKGTPIILSIIDRLKAKGYDIELVMIQNMPNPRVLEELAHCDFIVDQLYSDTPMAVFATEAAYFSKPTVVGGYFAAEAAQYIQPTDMPPSLFVTPDQVEAAIELLIVDVAFRQELGRRAHKFVCEHWSPEAVAGRYLRLVRGDVPDSWWFDPESVQYMFGCGVIRERMTRLVRSYIEYCGIEALALSHNPKLEQAYLALMEGSDAESVT